MKTKIDVLFRKEFNSAIVAIFPYEIYSGSFVTCYAHIGQHSGCSLDFIKETKPVSEAEYLSLKNELESISYDVNVIKRVQHKKYLKAYYNNLKDNI